jgi:hypothetical protein
MLLVVRARRAYKAQEFGDVTTRFKPRVAGWFDELNRFRYHPFAGWSSLVARRAHNPKVVGSNPTPATNSRDRRPGPDTWPFFIVCEVCEIRPFIDGKTKTKIPPCSARMGDPAAAHTATISPQRSWLTRHCSNSKIRGSFKHNDLSKKHGGASVNGPIVVVCGVLEGS